MFSLKELEKLGAKKGVLSQVIPDVVKGLVNDGLVDMDKIGGVLCCTFDVALRTSLLLMLKMSRLSHSSPVCICVSGGNFYWALPSKQGQRKKARLETLRADLSTAQDIIVREKARCEKLEAVRL